MAKGKLDRVQSACVVAAQTVINTPAAVAFETRIGAEEMKGIEIHRIQYDIKNPEAVFDANTTVIAGIGQVAKNIPDAITTTNTVRWPSGTLDTACWKSTGDISGVAGDQKLFETIVHDFSGAPMVAHPSSLYGMVADENAGVIAVVFITIWFKYLDFGEQDYRDLLQGYIIQNII